MAGWWFWKRLLRSVEVGDEVPGSRLVLGSRFGQTGETGGPSNGPMRTARAAFLLLFLAAGGLTHAVAQTTPQPAAQPPSATRGAIRVFLDCNYACDEEFVRKEITFVDYVRDRNDADVHILLTTQGTGGGGTEYTIKFIGLKRFAQVEQTLKHVAISTSTSDERRRAITEVLKRGLVRYVAESPVAPRIRITVAEEEDGKKTGQQDPAKDPWNLWVF